MTLGNVPVEVRIPRKARFRISVRAFLGATTIAIVACLQSFGCSTRRLPAFEVHAHRGALGTLPPGNLQSAFLEGIRDGATSLEADIRFTRDGRAIVNHDPELPSACVLPPDIPPEKPISELTFRQVKSAACVVRPGVIEPPISLEQFLDLHDRGTFGFNVEIKPGPKHAARTVAAIVQRYNRRCDECLDDRVVFQSFQIRDLRILNQIFPKKDGDRPHGFRLSFLSSSASVAELAGIASLVDVYSPDHRSVDAFEPLVRAARQHEIRFIPWTVNDPARICEVARAGADGIITDFPQRVTEIAALISTVKRRPRRCP